MAQVKTAFGFVILALPVFLLERVLGDVWGSRLWAMLGVAFFLWAFISSLSAKKAWMRVVQILFLAAALVSVRPLQDWAFGSNVTQPQAHLNFTQVRNVDELQRALAQANGKPVMLDLYADWCVACKEFEKYTFSDPQVQSALKETVLLQANVTANNAEDKALLKTLNVLGYIALNRGEQINALWIVVASVCIYLIAYRFYGLFIARKVLSVDGTRMTPAVRHNDGLDYVPTDKKVLFGHHFAAIAGAGPLVGPVLAAQMGYLPGMIWILAGVVLAGAGSLSLPSVCKSASWSSFCVPG
jgi:thiol-disulfide isomerase/thioredoxin